MRLIMCTVNVNQRPFEVTWGQHKTWPFQTTYMSFDVSWHDQCVGTTALGLGPFLVKKSAKKPQFGVANLTFDLMSLTLWPNVGFFCPIGTYWIVHHVKHSGTGMQECPSMPMWPDYVNTVNGGKAQLGIKWRLISQCWLCWKAHQLPFICA